MDVLRVEQRVLHAIGRGEPRERIAEAAGNVRVGAAHGEHAAVIVHGVHAQLRADVRQAIAQRHAELAGIARFDIGRAMHIGARGQCLGFVKCGRDVRLLAAGRRVGRDV